MAFNANNLTDEEIKTKLGNIPVSEITPTQSINLGIPTPEDTSGLLNTANGAVNYVNSLTTQATDAEKTFNESQNDITATMNTLLGKTADTQAAAETSGLNAATKQLRDLNAQASVLQREAQAIPLQTGIEFKNVKATKEGVQGVSTERLRDNALKALSIAQQADIATANYTAAKDKAQQIVDLKYQPLEQALAIKLQQYTFNKDILERIDKKRTEALGIALKKEEQELADKKQLEKDMQDLSLKVAQIDPTLTSKISSAKTFKEALAIASPALAKLNREIIKVGDSTKLVNKLTGEVIQDYGTGKSTKVNNFVISKDTLDTINGGNVVSTIADVIRKSGAKQSQSTNDAINVISGLQQLVNNNPTGEFAGINPIRLPGKLKSQEALRNLSDIEAINLKVQQWASGAALTEQQTKQVEKITPRKGDTDKQIRAKVNALANYMISQVSGQLAGQGVGFSMDSIDFFNKKPLDQDPLKVIGGSSSGADSLGLGI